MLNILRALLCFLLLLFGPLEDKVNALVRLNVF